MRLLKGSIIEETKQEILTKYFFLNGLIQTLGNRLNSFSSSFTSATFSGSEDHKRDSRKF